MSEHGGCALVLRVKGAASVYQGQFGASKHRKVCKLKYNSSEHSDYLSSSERNVIQDPYSTEKVFVSGNESRVSCHKYFAALMSAVLSLQDICGVRGSSVSINEMTKLTSSMH